MKSFIKTNKIIILLTTILLLPLIVYASYENIGFFSGFWHGVTFPFRLFLKLIWTDITIYEQFDSTYLYHVGYFLGALIIFGGGSRI